MNNPEKRSDRRGEQREPMTRIDQAATCPHDNCNCDLRYPIDWEQAEGTLWRVTLRCPNCEEISPGVMDEELIQKFDDKLDRRTDNFVRDLRVLTYANMATEVNRFVGLLDEGHILPEDFNFTPKPSGDPLVDRFYGLPRWYF